MKDIQLSQGKIALVDDDDYEELSKYRWFVQLGNRTFYARRAVTTGKYKHTSESMHRVIMQTPKGMDTDHRDGDGLNNQRYNLRLCTRSQNKMNSRLGKNNTSGYKGVRWVKESNKWSSQICVLGKKIYLGQFLDKEEAYKAYCEASKQYHGEYSNVINNSREE